MSHMKRTIDIENQDELMWMSNFDFEMEGGDLPDTSHWPAIKHLLYKLYRQANSDAWVIASLVEDKRYMGPAAARIKAAESALREAARELFIATGELG